VDIAIGYTFTKLAVTAYLGTVEEMVNFNNNEFILGDYTFTVDDKYKKIFRFVKV